MLVKFFATYRKISGVTSTSVEAPSDVLALLRELSERWPAVRDLFLDETGEKIGDDVIVMVNGRHIEHLDGAHTALCDDDRVALTPLVAGG